MPPSAPSCRRRRLASGRDIPDELSDIAMSCLHKDPASRLQSVGALIIRLTAYRRHAQAVTLAASSRAKLSAARAAGGARDELLRAALSSAEQAYAIWPEWRGAGLSLVNAQLGHAQHHLDSGAATAALSGCQRAIELASALRFARQEAAARRLAEAASATRRAQESTRRNLRLVRLGLAGALAALIIGLIVSVVVVTSAEGRMAGALHAEEAARAQAEAALRSLTDEQRSRSADQKRFAPAVIVQARKAMQGGQWDAAAHALEDRHRLRRQLGRGAHALRQRARRRRPLPRRPGRGHALARAGPWRCPGRAPARPVRARPRRGGARPRAQVGARRAVQR